MSDLPKPSDLHNGSSGPIQSSERAAEPSKLDKLPEFFDLVRARLVVGEQEYGDRSFANAASTNLDEIEEELLDVVGWAYPAWCTIRKLRAQLARLERTLTEEDV